MSRSWHNGQSEDITIRARPRMSLVVFRLWPWRRGGNETHEGDMSVRGRSPHLAQDGLSRRKKGGIPESAPPPAAVLGGFADLLASRWRRLLVTVAALAVSCLVPGSMLSQSTPAAGTIATAVAVPAPSGSDCAAVSCNRGAPSSPVRPEPHTGRHHCRRAPGLPRPMRRAAGAASYCRPALWVVVTAAPGLRSTSSLLDSRHRPVGHPARWRADAHTTPWSAQRRYPSRGAFPFRPREMSSHA